LPDCGVLSGEDRVANTYSLSLEPRAVDVRVERRCVTTDDEDGRVAAAEMVTIRLVREALLDIGTRDADEPAAWSALDGS